MKLLGYTSNSKDLNSTSDCFAASRKSELQVAISNEIMVMSMQRDELKATCDTSLKNELGVSPESSPMSSGSSASYSFCDDSLQMLNEDVAGFNMGEFTRKRSYIHFPFSYPSLEELMLARIKMDYELLEKEPSVCNLDAVIATLQNDINSRQYVVGAYVFNSNFQRFTLTIFLQDEIANVDLSSACEYFEGCGSSDVEESASLAADAKCPPFEGVLKFEEGPLREWPWSDSFEQTKLTFSRSAEENISLTHHKPTQFKSFRSCSPDKFGTEQHHENFAYQEHNKTLTIIIDSERNLDTPEDLSNRSLIIQGNIEDHTMNEQRNTVSNFVADFYGVVKVYLRKFLNGAYLCVIPLCSSRNLVRCPFEKVGISSRRRRRHT